MNVQILKHIHFSFLWNAFQTKSSAALELRNLEVKLWHVWEKPFPIKIMCSQKIVLKVKKDERYFYISKTNLSQWGGGGSQNQKSTKERWKWETKLIVTKTTGQTLCQVEKTGRSESPRKSFWYNIWSILMSWLLEWTCRT